MLVNKQPLTLNIAFLPCPNLAFIGNTIAVYY